MPSSRDIKKRIKSIGNTKKITKAMEMVAAAKMRQAIEAVLRTRPYANLSWAAILNLARTFEGKAGQDFHPLLAPKNLAVVKAGADKRVAIILITSNRGLCGGFNSAIIKKVLELVKNTTPLSAEGGSPPVADQPLAGANPSGGNPPLPSSPIRRAGFVKGENAKYNPPNPLYQGGKYEFILLGKKGAAVHKNFGFEVTADFPKLDYINELREVVPAARMAIKDYLAGKYDKVMVAYTDYINAVKQLPRLKQLLPVEITEMDEYLGKLGAKEESTVGAIHELPLPCEYLFEPSPEEVLDEMLPRLIEIQLFQALLESSASEHSARRLAMHQATAAAGDMVDELTLSFNKARQASITSEIAEISAGANALA